MKRIFFAAVLLSLVLQIKAQQIGNGVAATINSDFGTPLLSGIYQSTTLQTNFPADTEQINKWKYLLNIRHSGTGNNHQFQLATSVV